MTWLTLAVSNVRHQARQYTAFFLSSAFAVWMFFLFVSLLYHPALSDDLRRYGAQSTFSFVAGLVAVFAVLFVFYASSAFLRSRKRELGIFSLLGMLPGQVAAIIFTENGLIGLGAIAAGLGAGVICSKLFFLLVGRVLGLPAQVPFHLSLTAVLLTVLIFAAVFLFVSLLGQVSLRRISVAEVFRSATRPRIPPRFRWWLAGLSLACLAGGYALVLMPGHWTEVERRMWPGALLVLIGTYLVFHQGSVAALQLLRRRQSLYYRRTSLLAISQMLHKVRDNTKVLFMVSILTALVLAPLTVVVVAYREAEQTALLISPVGLSVEQKQGERNHELALAALREHGLDVQGQAAVPLLPIMTRYLSDRLPNVKGFTPAPGMPLPPGVTTFNRGALVPVSAFNQWAALAAGEAPVSLPDGQGVLFGTEAPAGQALDLGLTFGGADLKAHSDLPVDIHLTATRVERPLVRISRQYYSLLVVDDATFADLSARFGAAAQGQEVHAFALDDWKQALPAIEALTAAGVTAYGTADTYRERLMEGQTGLLVLGFIVVLFFLATGQMLYFKLFTDLTAERQQYQALFRVGLQAREVQRVVSAQTLVLFFAPLAVALAHAWVFLSMMRNIEGSSVDIGTPFLLVAGAYLVLFGGYYLAARRTYVKALLS